MPPPRTCARNCNSVRNATSAQLRPAAQAPRQWRNSTTKPAAPAAARRARLARQSPMARWAAHVRRGRPA
eukprot:7761185-Alexandrium_andersonii.AAC.1